MFGNVFPENIFQGIYYQESISGNRFLENISLANKYISWNLFPEICLEIYFQTSISRNIFPEIFGHLSEQPTLRIYFGTYISRNMFPGIYFWKYVSRDIFLEIYFWKSSSGNRFPESISGNRFLEIYFWKSISGKIRKIFPEIDISGNRFLEIYLRAYISAIYSRKYITTEKWGGGQTRLFRCSGTLVQIVARRKFNEHTKPSQDDRDR